MVETPSNQTSDLQVQPSWPHAAGGENDQSHEQEKKEAHEETTTQETTPQSRRTRFKSILFDILETLLLTIVFYAILSTFIGRYKVLSVSMEPNLYEGEYLLISKQTYKIWSPVRGDVVVFRYPRDLQKNYIKRLIGLPGEEVELRDGQLYIDGELVSEPWLVNQPRATSGRWVLGQDEYFVMGDNRDNSSDSRAWGSISHQHIIGKALLCYWPVNCWGLIRHGPQPNATSATSLPDALTNPLTTSATP